MKIGFVLDDSLDKTDGVQQYVLSLGQWFSHRGHQVHYLVGQSRRKDITHIHSLSRNIQVHFNQNRMSTPLPAKRSKISELLYKEKFDVLHVQMPYSPFLSGRIIKKADNNTAVIGTFHIVPSSKLEKYATRILRLLLIRSLKRFDFVFSVSTPAKKFAKKSFGTKSVVLPNTINLAPFHNAKKIKKYDDGKINIVYLGRLVERKGCIYLLHAVEQLHKSGLLENVRILICGKGPLELTLKKFVSEHRLKKNVIFTGYLNEDIKPSYLASADIAVFPSTGGESFGIVLIEAMAAGASVVLAGNNVGYRSVLGINSKQLIDPRNTDSFAAVLMHYILNGAIRKKTAKWQINFVSQFDVNSVGPKILSVYQSVVAKRSNNSDNKDNEVNSES